MLIHLSSTFHHLLNDGIFDLPYDLLNFALVALPDLADNSGVEPQMANFIWGVVEANAQSGAIHMPIKPLPKMYLVITLQRVLHPMLAWMMVLAIIRWQAKELGHLPCTHRTI